PVLERVGRRLAAALFHGPLITAARRMRIDLIRGAILDVDHPAVGFPTRDSGSIVVVRVGDTAVQFFFIFVFFGIRRRIAALPEILNELFAFFVRLQMLKSLALLVRDDICDVFVQPLLPWTLKLFPELLLSPFLFLFGKWLGHRGV